MALTRRAFGGLTIGGSSALMLAACGGNDGDGGSEGGGELVWAVSSGWSAWNRNTGTGNASATNIATTPMNPVGTLGYDFDPEGNVFYDEAIFEGAPELLNEAPMQVQLTLKEGAQWSDGKPVRLEDFIFQWYSTSGDPLHANQEKALPAGTAMANIASIEEPEPGKIVLTFKEGTTDPEWIFNGGVYLPSHVAEANGFEAWATDPEVMGDAVNFFNDDLWDVVIGPYKPVEWKVGEYVIYEPNENYQGEHKASYDKLTMKAIEGIEAQVTELRQGTIAGCWPNDFSLEIMQPLEDQPELAYETYAGATWSHFDMNVNNTFLKDVALRQAVFTAIDIEEIKSRAFPGTEAPWLGNHFFTEESPYYVDYTGPANYGKGDIEAAKTILTGAGYTTNGDGKLLAPGGEQVLFNFRFASSNEIRKLTGEIIQAQLVELGIDLELKGFGDDELSTTLSEGDFDLVVFSWVGNPAFTTSPDQFFSPDSDSNHGNYDDPVINELLPQVRATLELDAAAEVANQISAQAVAQAYTLPLYSSPMAVFWNTEMVSGLEVNPASQASALWNVREWKRP
ncbi:ABC transporter substrate-binding protein [Glycomyces tritici]|uniref:ABC transporter substrate-binding protein n=1 Tax=Glycomyces tritici TaxID=2665176 RepID=A0ABT7YW33_9ACTN|nr:ABC transporter substrate-binding protein [Glycomyces tritici]MDN3240969.1 ABC transporter substrate-binding protein [Glycomyces tritici]MDN3242828.1 ABC transporter substrate-binding protein [Glycomyces tritici]